LVEPGRRERYPDAREIFITADAGGSNSYRSHVWKQQLQRLADKLDMSIQVSHSRPARASGTRSSTGSSPSSRSTGAAGPCGPTTIINLIGNTTHRGGLVVRARLDRRSYPTGKKVSAKELRELKIERNDFHGDWNYVISRARKDVDRPTCPFAGPYSGPPQRARGDSAGTSACQPCANRGELERWARLDAPLRLR